MEPLPKRLRLFAPTASSNAHAYEEESDGYYDLYDDEDTAIGAGEDDEDGEEVEDEDDGEQDPDMELEQTRAQLDYKLKSKFEAIFEKYGKDFTGIGDEIDLKTGDIVVDNGHLFGMQDERDAGTARGSLLRAFTEEPDERLGSSEDEDEDEESDSVDDGHVTLEDMEEDDMILYQSSGFASRGHKTPAVRTTFSDNLSTCGQDSRVVPAHRIAYPSETEIVAQFGQRIGPKIARYVSQQRVHNDLSIEPAWRTPGLPLATPGRRPILKSILLQPDIDRPPSPKGSSVWAPKMPPGRPRRDGADVAAIFKGETIVRDRTWYSSGYMSTTLTKRRSEQTTQSQPGHRTSLTLKKTLDPADNRLGPGQRSKLSPAAIGVSYKAANISNYEEESTYDESSKSRGPLDSHSTQEIRRGRGRPRKLRPEPNNLNQITLPAISADVPTAKREFDKRAKGGSAPRTRFTEADDEAVIEWVVEAQRQGYALWSWTHWRIFGERNTRHTFLSWLDRYRKHLWPKGVINSEDEEAVEGHKRDRSGDPPKAQRLRRSSSFGSSQFSSSPEATSHHNYRPPDESSYETRQAAPPMTSRTFRPRIPQKRDPSKISWTEAVETIENIDPDLHAGLLQDAMGADKPDSPWPQRSLSIEIPSFSSTAVTGEPVALVPTSENVSPVKSSSSISIPHEEVRQEYHPVPCEGPSGGIGSNDHEIVTECTGNDSVHGSPQSGSPGARSPPPAMSAIGVNGWCSTVQSSQKIASDTQNEITAHAASSMLNSISSTISHEPNPTIPSPDHPSSKQAGIKLLEQFSRNVVDSSYSFSDDEEDAEPQQPKLLPSVNISAEATSPTFVQTQKANIQTPTSLTAQQTETDLPALPIPSLECNESSMQLPMTSPQTKAPDSPRMRSPPTLSTPVTTARNPHQLTRSHIPDSDEFDELSMTPEELAILSSQSRPRVPASQPHPRRLADDGVKTMSPARSFSTPKSISRGSSLITTSVRPSPASKSTPKHTKSASGFVASVRAGPGGPLIETPGGSFRLCGESGFRCWRDFCFKCQ